MAGIGQGVKCRQIKKDVTNRRHTFDKFEIKQLRYKSKEYREKNIIYRYGWCNCRFQKRNRSTFSK